MKTLPILLACLTFTLSCESIKVKQSIRKSTFVKEAESIIKPIKGFKNPERIFKINASENSIIHLPNGGSIEIPKNSLVNKNGEQVVGPVDLKWKEFHSLTDIMLSGIPMKYDSLGKSYDFVSGGMFSISAEQKKEEVNIKPGNTVKVNLASIQDEKSFNFYALNEKTGVWSYDTTVVAESIPKETPEDSSTIIDAKVDISNFPQLHKEQIVGWRCIEKLSNDQKVLIQKLSSKVTLSTDDISYKLNFQHKKNQWQVRVKPYLLSDALKNDEKKKAELKTNYEQILAYQNNLKRGRTMRSIALKNFGTHNWDHPYCPPNAKNLSAQFNFGKSINPKLVSVFLVSIDENLIISYPSDKAPNFAFNTKNNNCLVALMPDQRVLFVTNEGLEPARNAPDRSFYKFKFRDLGIKVSSGEELAQCILSITKKS